MKKEEEDTKHYLYRFNIRPCFEVLVMIVVDHLEVEGHVGVVDSATASLVVAPEEVSLLYAVGQVILNLLHLVSQTIDLNQRFDIKVCKNNSSNLHLQTLFVLLSPQSALHSISEI